MKGERKAYEKGRGKDYEKKISSVLRLVLGLLDVKISLMRERGGKKKREKKGGMQKKERRKKPARGPFDGVNHAEKFAKKRKGKKKRKKNLSKGKKKKKNKGGKRGLRTQRHATSTLLIELGQMSREKKGGGQKKRGGKWVNHIDVASLLSQRRLSLGVAGRTKRRRRKTKKREEEMDRWGRDGDKVIIAAALSGLRVDMVN